MNQDNEAVVWYNTELKEQFVEYEAQQHSEVNRKILFFLFNHSEPIEKKYGKDLADFDEDQLTEVLQSLQYVKYATLRHMKAPMRNYICWYKGTQYGEYMRDYPIPLHRVTLWRAMTRVLIFSPEELINQTSHYSADAGSMFQVACIMFWLGFDKKTACNVKRSDVSIRNGRVWLGDRDTLYEEFQEPLIYYAEHEQFGPMPNGYMRAKAAGDMFLRNLYVDNPEYERKRSKVATPATVQNQINYTVKKLDNQRLWMQSINMSGEMCRLWELSENGEVSNATIQAVTGRKPMSFTSFTDAQIDFDEYIKAREYKGI